MLIEFVFVSKVAFRNDPESALIQFASPEEASRAIRSTEAVLDNRFICMRWYRGNDGAEPQPQAQLATVKVKLIPTNSPCRTNHS